MANTLIAIFVLAMIYDEISNAEEFIRLRANPQIERPKQRSIWNIRRENPRLIHSDGIIFPDMFEKMNTNRWGSPGNSSTGTNGLMPLELAKRFNDLENIDEFIEEFAVNKDDFLEDIEVGGNGNNYGSRVVIATRAFGHTAQRKRVTSTNLAKPATCQPGPTVISLVPEVHESNVFFLPPCTRVNRCGGCCGSHLLHCESIENKTKNVQIMEMSESKQNTIIKRVINVDVVEHVKCKCKCIIKETDCNINQMYIEKECRCACNSDGGITENECHALGRYWDNAKCQCLCQYKSECSTGSYFDHDTCSCTRK